MKNRPKGQRMLPSTFPKDENITLQEEEERWSNTKELELQQANQTARKNRRENSRKPLTTSSSRNARTDESGPEAASPSLNLPRTESSTGRRRQTRRPTTF
jgi:hypothetical protein